MEKLIKKIREMFNDWVEQGDRDFEQNTMMELTAGLGVTPNLFKAMEEKGWQIDASQKGPVILRSEYSSSTFNSLARDVAQSYWHFTADKGGQKQGSIAWYRDLCDVLGYDRSSIPDRDVRESGVRFGGFSL